MSSTIAPERSTIRRLTFLLLACALAANLAVPTANAASTDCAPGEGGAGAAIGYSYGFAAAWNCASVMYHESPEGMDVVVTVLGSGVGTTL